MIMHDVDFNQLVNYICKSQSVFALKTVVEKELLHYDILYALTQHNLLEGLIFQGGTALRLCYNLQRYSEDLDFVGGVNFDKNQFVKIKQILEEYIFNRYGLTLLVKEPKSANKENKVNVTRWHLSVITNPGKKDIPQQKIRIEIANIPAYTKKLMPISSNYDFLPDGYSDTFINVESIEEIMADKIIAYVARPYIKNRDIWDLQWLYRKKIKIDIELIKNKIVDYGILGFNNLLKDRTRMLEQAVKSESFTSEMSRFLNIKTREQTINRDGFLKYVAESVRELLDQVMDNCH